MENRRDFLKRAALLTAATPFAINCKDAAIAAQTDVLARIRKNARPRGAEGVGAIDAPEAVSWRTVLPQKSARDEPLKIFGTVFKADGATPAPDVLIYFYHTDGDGLYGRGGEPRHGRYRGWLLTDAAGRYEFRSIKPAPYPNGKQSAHIHMTVTGTNFGEDWIDSILFEGDKLITKQELRQAGLRGGFNPILKLEKDANGVFCGRRDILLRERT